MTAGGPPPAATGDLSGMAGRVLGVLLRGRLPAGFAPFLEGPAPAGSPNPGGADTALHLDLTWRPVEALPAVEAIWEGDAEAGRDPAPPWRFSLFRHGRGFGLAVGGGAEGRIRFGPTDAVLEWKRGAGAAPHLFFAYALPLWLEGRGVPVLHGSAVTSGGAAVGFLAPTGTGKSTLCAGLAELGWGFLADDGLALHSHPGGGWACPPGPPLLRLWPSTLAARPTWAERALPPVPAEGDKRRVPAPVAGPGTAAEAGTEAGGTDGGTGLGDRGAGDRGAGDRGAGGRRDGDPPLAGLYVLRRRPGADGGAEVSRVDPRRALVHLLAHGVAGAPAAALGLSERRFAILAEVAAAVPVWRLDIPSTPDAAERVAEVLQGEQHRRDLPGG